MSSASRTISDGDLELSQSIKSAPNSQRRISTVARQADSSVERTPLSCLISMAIDECAIDQKFSARDILQRFPELRKNASAAAEIALEEFSRRNEAGETISLPDFAASFPECQDELLHLLQNYDLILKVAMESSESNSVSWPVFGEKLGDFQIHERLGRGAFSTVYFSQQTSVHNRPVALKCTTNLRHEVESLANLNHPNVVPIYHVSKFEDRGFSAICMPFFGRCTLSDVTIWLERRLKSGDSFPEDAKQVLDFVERKEAEFESKQVGRLQRQTALGQNRKENSTSYVDFVLEIGTQILNALAATHEEGIYHCDIKPSNVLIDPKGVARLIDFNLAVVDSSKAPGGTLPYMSPEQLRAVMNRHLEPGPMSAATDLYGWGILMWQLSTGSLPFGSSNQLSNSPSEGREQHIRSLLNRRENVSLEKLHELAPHLPSRLSEAIIWALQFKADDRPQDADSLLELINLQPKPNVAEYQIGAAPAEVMEQPSSGTPGNSEQTSYRYAIVSFAALAAILVVSLLMAGLDDSKHQLVSQPDDLDQSSQDPIAPPSTRPLFDIENQALAERRETLKHFLINEQYHSAYSCLIPWDRVERRNLGLTIEDYVQYLYIDGFNYVRAPKYRKGIARELLFRQGFEASEFEGVVITMLNPGNDFDPLKRNRLILNLLGNRSWGPIAPRLLVQVVDQIDHDNFSLEEQPANYGHVLMVYHCTQALEWMRRTGNAVEEFKPEESDEELSLATKKVYQHLDQARHFLSVSQNMNHRVEDQKLDAILVRVVLAACLPDEDSRSEYKVLVEEQFSVEGQSDSLIPKSARPKITRLIESLTMDGDFASQQEDLLNLAEIWRTFCRSDTNWVVPSPLYAEEIYSLQEVGELKVRDYDRPYDNGHPNFEHAPYRKRDELE